MITLLYAKRGAIDVVIWKQDNNTVLVNEEQFEKEFTEFGENPSFQIEDKLFGYDFVHELIRDDNTTLTDGIAIEDYDICLKIDEDYIFITGTENFTTGKQWWDNLGQY